MGEKDPVRMWVACLCATLAPRPEPRLGLSALSYSGVHKVEAPKPYRTKGWGVEREIGTRLPKLQPQGMRRPRESKGKSEKKTEKERERKRKREKARERERERERERVKIMRYAR